jgi:hypothetical protein
VISSLRRRIRRLEEELFLPPDGDPPLLIRVTGGLPEGKDAELVLHATLGHAGRLDSLPAEPLNVFESRALDAAAAAGEPFVVVQLPAIAYGKPAFRR